jgi:hypothetical protein
MFLMLSLGRQALDARAREAPDYAATAPVTIKVLRSVSEVEGIRDAWTQMQRHPNADIDFFLNVVESRPQILRPHVVVLSRDGRPTAILAGRIENRFLESKFGYKVIHRSPVVGLTVIYGGLLGDFSPSNSTLIMKCLVKSLADQEADLIWFNGIRSDSPMYQIGRRASGVLFSDFAPELNLHWKVNLPGSYEQFLQSLSSKTRYNLRAYSSRLLKTFGKALSVRCFRQKTELDQIVHDTEFVAAKTYHRGLGVGFVDDAETRRLTAFSLERGWFRAYILYVGGTPCAFWHGLQYGRTFFTGCTGSDPAYREHRLGTCLLTKVFEDLCRDAGVGEVDFGLGDAEYKRHLCNQSWLEASAYVFAPTIRGLALNSLRTPFLLVDRSARRVVGRSGLLTKIKTLWRKRAAQTLC